MPVSRPGLSDIVRQHGDIDLRIMRGHIERTMTKHRADRLERSSRDAA